MCGYRSSSLSQWKANVHARLRGMKKNLFPYQIRKEKLKWGERNTEGNGNDVLKNSEENIRSVKSNKPLYQQHRETVFCTQRNTNGKNIIRRG